jgi:hypothetical protein
VQFRKTWRMRDALLAIKIGGGPSPEYRTSFEEGQLLSVSYARALRSEGSLTRARWYIEPGFGTAGRDPDGDHIYEIGVKAGVRLDLAGYGIVDLYLMGSQDPQR